MVQRLGAPLRSRPLFPRHLEAMNMRTRKIFGVSLSLILINLAAIMERADENLLPSVYKEVSEAFNAGPSDLGYLTFIRNFVQGLASPLAGVLVINHDRPTVLAMGTFCWALSTAAVGASQHFLQVAFWRAINGFGLAIVIPALQSFIADSYMDGVRGTGFGLLSLVGSLGGIGDPRKTVSINHDTGEAEEKKVLSEKGNAISTASFWRESWMAMKTVMKVQTFQVIVLQGIVGSLPWTAMVFFTMWFELVGFDHNGTATLLSLFAIGCALGSLLGGLIADKLSQIYPHSGRIMCAQFSAFMGIPFSLYLLRVIPQSVSSYYTFATTLFLMGLTISWNGSAVNAPVFAEVVPAKHRTMIYAFDRAFEGSFSSVAAPLVGIISEKIYGYDSKSVDPVGGSAPEALALSKGLLSMMAVPFDVPNVNNTFWGG
ncbi:hypothetical protein CMV_020939 [Castanea mollissima]|uniref:Major facilitator superfamily (MFS) profile domain-containing protein n=1 Tax=Castanea mollissima TaxID=60419 RepID=A0A8J4QX50_9ROSI|nr:hypothetical protein CMV_020939 [Castanea mollissima]